MVYKNHSKTTANNTGTTKSSTTNTSSNNSTAQSPNLLADSKTYTAPDGSFTVKYPSSWLSKECSGSAYLGLALTADGLLQDCNAQPKPIYGFVIYFQSYAKGPGFNPAENSDNFSRQPYDYEASYVHTAVQLNSKTVDKSVSVHKADTADDPIAGATVLTYRYYDKSKLWYAVYTNLSGSKDLSGYFDAMVQSWKF